MLVDTHSHIYSEEFDNDRDEVVARAEAAGVGRIFLPAIDRDSYDRQDRLSLSRPDFFCQMMGLHPTSINEDYLTGLSKAHSLLFTNPDKYVGVGEVGLDFYWDTTFRDEQVDALSQQMGWADELEKPVVLHLRSGKENSIDTDAYHAIINILKDIGMPSAGCVMHCFSGTLDDALRAVDYGFFLGIGGTVTYKKSSIPDIVKAISLDHLLLETDSPYLAPVPFRGRRNESSYVAIVAQAVADIKGCSVDEVEEVTTANALTLFKV